MAQQRNPFDQFDAPANGLPPGAQVLVPIAPQVQAREAVDLSNARLSGQRTAQQIALDASTADADRRKAAAEATKAEADARRSALEAAKAGTANPAAARIQNQLQTDDVLSSIQRARDQINGGWATGIPGAILGRFPGTASADLGGTLNTIGSNVTQGVLANLKAQSSTGASGFGALSETEGRLLRDSVASLGQNQSSDQLLNSLAAIERHYRNMLAIQNNEDPRDPAIAKKYNIMLPSQAGDMNKGGTPPSGGSTPPGGGYTGEQMVLSNNGYETVADPTLKGVNAHVRSLIGAGRSAKDIVAYLNSVAPGVGDQRAADIQAATTFRAQNPNVPLAKYPISLENKTVPLSPVHNAINTAAQSGPGAAALNIVDAVTGGYLDNITPNPALARAGMSAVSAEHPYWAIGGQIGGAGLAGAAAELGAARMGLTGVKALRAADLGYGALYGSGNADEGSRLNGAVGGALAGSAGGMFGRGFTRVGGRAIAGVQDAGRRALLSAGVPLTAGQAAGGAAKAVEDRLSGLPGVGDLINARRREGSTAAQRYAFDHALSSIGGTTDGAIAENGVASGLRQVGDAYDRALSSVQVTTDAPYKATTGQIAQQVQQIPRIGGELASALDATVTPMFNNGTLSGSSMQAVDRGLQQLRAGYSSDPLFATHIAPAIDSVGNNVRGLFERQAPDVLPGYDAAKAAYRNMSVLSDAVNAGVNTGGEFTMAQLGQQARKNAIKFGGRNAAASGDRPFAVFQRAAQEVLPSKIPDSGTAGRVALPTIAAGIGGLTGYGASKEDDRKGNAILSGLALGSLAALPYTKAAQNAVAKTLLAERSPLTVAIGNGINKRSRLGGMMFRPISLDYFAGPTAFSGN